MNEKMSKYKVYYGFWIKVEAANRRQAEKDAHDRLKEELRDSNFDVEEFRPQKIVKEQKS